MNTANNGDLGHCAVREVRILSGIIADDVETILNMAVVSGVFSSDAMMSLEDMAWDSAYGDGNKSHTFLKSTISESGVDKTVGFICFGPIPHWQGRFEMYGIAVDPEFQRLGIGSALIAEMNRQVARTKGKQVFLETGDDRLFEDARQFYEANGFIHEYRFFKQFIPVDGGVVYRFDIDTDDSDENYQ